jgi:hypothetical protein
MRLVAVTDQAIVSLAKAIAAGFVQVTVEE